VTFQVDLTNCDREPIHTSGAVQPHGVLLVVSSELVVLQASVNVGLFFGVEASALVGQPLSRVLDAAAVAGLAANLAPDAGPPVNPLRVLSRDGGRPFDAIVARGAQGTLVELEPAPDNAAELSFAAFYQQVRVAITRLQAAPSVIALCERAVAEVRAMTGFDRVMAYRFDRDDHGHVIVENKREELESYLDLHYPASDIPAQARRLYTINRLRTIADVAYAPVPIVPALSPVDGAPLDLSDSVLRSVSPIHVQYLQNMGIHASMSISLVIDGRLWGMIICHHYQAKVVPYVVRAACDFLSQSLSWQLAASERADRTDKRTQAEGELRRIMKELTAAKDLEQGVAQSAPQLLALTQATGAALVHAGRVSCFGVTPSMDEVDALTAWLRERAGSGTFSSEHLAADYSPLEGGVAAGLLAVPLEPAGGSWMLWFRPEVTRTVDWAGEPHKQVSIENGETRLTPRGSFALWKETVRGHSEPWQPWHLEIARELGHAIAGVVLAHAATIGKLNVELRQREQSLLRVNEELRESHRGVVALLAELEEKAGELRVGAEIKTRIVANASHEFRTPLNSILGLSKLLLDGADGPLNEEQEKQVRFIRSASKELYTLVNDMLDVAKVESGKAVLRIEPFALEDMFAALRGTMRPLLAADSEVELIVEPAPAGLTLETDQGKLAQILRNLLANALKFTERGEVRLSTRVVDDEVHFAVRDTGIGIALPDQDRIFEEFAQVDSAVQRRVKGSGLGLHLSRSLADLLGGSLRVTSTPGEGSTFTCVVPRKHDEAVELHKIEARSRSIDPKRAPVLVIEDDRKTIFLYERFLARSGFQVVPARTIEDGRALLKTLRPAAIVLDIMLENETSWRFLGDVKTNPETKDIPVLVVTITDREQKARALGADEFWLKPLDEGRLVQKLESLSTKTRAATVLAIDDDEAARYLVRKYLADTPYTLLEAADGDTGVRLALEELPNIILLDFLLDRITAFDVLDQLKGDARTREIPVIIITSHVLPLEQRRRLAEQTEAIISKENLSRELAIHRIQDALLKAGFNSRGPRSSDSAPR
jgi:light-regulated signal transduction histidine kinase (bacteriophytochrome)/response regulator RpfG family c-di-GMP phosphodiesterase